MGTPKWFTTEATALSKSKDIVRSGFPKKPFVLGGWMTRRTSIEAYNEIKENGLLSRRRFQVYESLALLHRSATASEIATKMPGQKSESVGANIHARLGELRECGVVEEDGETKCPLTGMMVILWKITSNLPIKKTKPTRIKCKECNGKGYHLQERLL
jgi:hypothetical protein